MFGGEFAGPKAKARLSRSRHGSSVRATSAASAQHDQTLVGTPGKMGIRRKRNSCVDGFSIYLFEKMWLGGAFDVFVHVKRRIDVAMGDAGFC